MKFVLFLIFNLLFISNALSQGNTNTGGERTISKEKGILYKVSKTLLYPIECGQVLKDIKPLEKKFLKNSNSLEAKKMSFFDFIDYLNLSLDLKSLEGIDFQKALQKKCDCSESKKIIEAIIDEYNRKELLDNKCIKKRLKYLDKLKKIKASL